MPSKTKWYTYLPVILAIPLGIALIKGLPKSDFFKELNEGSRIKSAVYINPVPSTNHLDLYISNTNIFAFNNLIAKCIYKDIEGREIGSQQYKIDGLFRSKAKRVIKSQSSNISLSKVNSIFCYASEFTQLTEEDANKAQNEILDQIFGKNP